MNYTYRHHNGGRLLRMLLTLPATSAISLRTSKENPFNRSRFVGRSKLCSPFARRVPHCSRRQQGDHGYQHLYPATVAATFCGTLIQPNHPQLLRSLNQNHLLPATKLQPHPHPLSSSMNHLHLPNEVMPRPTLTKRWPINFYHDTGFTVILPATIPLSRSPNQTATPLHGLPEAAVNSRREPVLVTKLDINVPSGCSRRWTTYKKLNHLPSSCFSRALVKVAKQWKQPFYQQKAQKFDP